MRVFYLFSLSIFYTFGFAQLHPFEGWKPTDTSHVQLRSITIAGNKKTKIYIIQREFTFKEGDIFSGGDLINKIKLTREQLYNTSLFVDVIVSLKDAGNQQVDMSILVKERWYLFPLPYFRVVDRNWNDWIHTYKASLDRVNIGLKLSHFNFSGRNDKANLFLIGGYTQAAAFSYSTPYFDNKLRHGLSLGFSFSRNREVTYATDSNKLRNVKESFFSQKSIHGSAIYTYRKGSHERFSAGITYNYDEIDKSIQDTISKYHYLDYFGNKKLAVSYVDIGLGYSANYTDYKYYPLVGWQYDLSFGRRMGADVGMWSVEGKFLKTEKLFSNTYVMFQVAGAAKILDNQNYFNSHLMGYGDIAMRGLEYYVIDGSAGGLVRGTVRQKLFGITLKNIIKSKTHDRIPFTIYGKTYSDLGYVYSENPGISFLNNKLLHTYGFGVDIVTVYDVALKLEYSFNQLGGSGFFFHTSTDF